MLGGSLIGADGSLIQTRHIHKAIVFVLGYGISFALAYSLILYIQRRHVISQAVGILKAQEEFHQKRLFGDNE